MFNLLFDSSPFSFNLQKICFYASKRQQFNCWCVFWTCCKNCHQFYFCDKFRWWIPLGWTLILVKSVGMNWEEWVRWNIIISFIVKITHLTSDYKNFCYFLHRTGDLRICSINIESPGRNEWKKEEGSRGSLRNYENLRRQTQSWDQTGGQWWKTGMHSLSVLFSLKIRIVLKIYFDVIYFL